MKQPEDRATRELLQPPSAAPAAPDRARLSLDLAPPVASLLEHVSNVTGVPRSQVVVQALLDALPALLDRVDGLSRRHQALTQPAKPQPGGKR